MSIEINNKRDDLVSLLVSENTGDKSVGVQSSRRRYKHLIVIPLAVIASVLAIVGSLRVAFGGDSDKPEVVAASSYDTGSNSSYQAGTSVGDPRLPVPITTDDEVTLNAAGFVVARRLATASSEVMGVLTSVDVDEGMHVQQGEVLATIDSSVLQEDIRLATYEKELAALQYARLKTELEESLRQYHRVEALVKNGYVAIREFDEIKFQQGILRLRLQEAEVQNNLATTRLDRLAQELDKYTVKAPFSGVVIGKNAQPGEIVSPSSAGGGFTRTGICTIVDMSSLEIEVDVNERFLQKIAVGQPVVANLDAYPEWDINGSVIAIIPAANRSKGTVRVRIKILESDQRIIPDMSLRVSFWKAS